MRSEIRHYLAEIGSKGGKERAARYSKAMLSKWAKLGGRPRKGAQAKPKLRRGKGQQK